MTACAPGGIGAEETGEETTGVALECLEHVHLTTDDLGRLWAMSGDWEGEIQTITPDSLESAYKTGLLQSDAACWPQDGTTIHICAINMLPCHVPIGRLLDEMPALGFNIVGDTSCPGAGPWGPTYRDQFNECWGEFDTEAGKIVVRIR